MWLRGSLNLVRVQNDREVITESRHTDLCLEEILGILSM